MNSRSRIYIFGAALGGCLLLLVCAAVLGVAGFVMLSGQNPLAVLAPPSVNRIAYVGNDANIYVIDPAGKTKIKLTKDGDGGKSRAYSFPAWSPDSSHLAFAGYDLAQGSPKTSALYSITPSGTGELTLYRSDQFTPFFLYWSPDSHYVTFLTDKGSDTVALRLVTANKANSDQELESGAPLFFAWAPDSRRMFLHVGDSQQGSTDTHLALLPLGPNHSARSLDARPGAFQTPQWSPDGQHLLFSRQDAASKQVVAVANAQGTDAHVLFDYQGRVSFAWSPSGSRIAYIVTEDNITLPNFGPLKVIDANGQNPRQISDDHTLAFFWSPNGNRLAYLTLLMQPGGGTGYRFQGPAQGNTQIQLVWKVADLETGKNVTVAIFQPTDDFIGILPVFDQYARAATRWSPDSQSLVYTAADDNGNGAVYVGDATAKSAPRKIADGTLAFWSWK